MLKSIKKNFFCWLEEKLPYEQYIMIRSRYYWLSTPSEWHEKYRFPYFLSKKKNAGKKYCIFRYAEPGSSLFSSGLGHIFSYEWAVSKGYIPIVDIEYAYDFQKKCLGKNNEWEYCFEQSMNIKEVIGQDWVLVEQVGRNGTWLEETCLDINGSRDDAMIHVMATNWKDYYKKVNQYIKKIWIFKESFLNEYRQECGCRIKQGDVVIGLFLREEFSVDVAKERTNKTARELYKKHPLTIGIHEIFELVKKYMEDWGCNKLFISTEIQDSLDLFLGEFGDKVIYVSRKRVRSSLYRNHDQYWDMDAEGKRDYDKKLNEMLNKKDKTIAYAKEVYGLSLCDYLIAPKSSGTAAALALNGGKYRDICILPDFNNIERY